MVFADVVDYTSLADGSDPEHISRLLDTAFRQVGEIVGSHGGTIDKYIGDSVMAVFGVPVAHEDDAERAVAAALAIQEAKLDVRFSVGVNSGEVMVMAMGGGAITVMGDAVNVAARLEKAAKQGEVLVGPDTVELTEARIRYRERPPMTLKGKREPVEVRQALGLRETPVPTDTAGAPLVGRGDELDFLLAQWRKVCSIRRSSIVMVTGDPGIGKTRLLDELVARTKGEGFVVRSTYPPYGGSGGVRVSSDIVAQLGPSTDPRVQARIRSLMGDVHPSLRNMDPDALRQEQLWALRRLAEDQTTKRPMMLLIEDVHMASTSIDLLSSIVARLSDLPVLVVFAGRPEGRWLNSFTMASSVRLAPLSRTDTESLAAWWSRSGPVDDSIVQLSGGNPLFLRELLAFASDHPGARSDQYLPLSLRAVLAARLDALAVTERAALQDLAVIGDRATVDQLVALGGQTSSDGVTSLTNTGLVRHRPDGTLRITEPLLREVAYETLPLSTRVERHMRMAEIGVSAEERARHLELASGHAPDDAELQARAATAIAEAGLDALDRSRAAEAVALFRRSVALGHRDPNNLLRFAAILVESHVGEALEILKLVPAPSGDARTDAERTLVTANALVSSDLEAALVAFDEAAQQWHELGDVIKEGWSHSNKAFALFMNGRWSEADTALSRGLGLFRRARHRTGEMAAIRLRALVRPDHPNVEAWLHESLTYAEEIGDRTRHLAAFVSLAWHHFLRNRLGGEAESAETNTWINESIALATELGADPSLVQVLTLRANLARMAGRFAEAKESLSRIRRIPVTESPGGHALLRAVTASIELGQPFEAFTGTDPFTSVAGVIQIESALFEGRFNELVDRGLLDRKNLGRHEALVGFVSVAAGLVSVGRFDEGEAMALEATRAADRSRSLAGGIAARAIAAECAARRGDTAAALALLPDVGATLPGGLAGALVHRATAMLGDHMALVSLHNDAELLKAPGLLIGLPELVSGSG